MVAEESIVQESSALGCNIRWEEKDWPTVVMSAPIWRGPEDIRIPSDLSIVGYDDQEELAVLQVNFSLPSKFKPMPNLRKDALHRSLFGRTQPRSLLWKAS